MVLKVYDKDAAIFDALDKDDPLGEARVALGALRAGYAEEFEVALEGKKATGTISFALSWAEEGSA